MYPCIFLFLRKFIGYQLALPCKESLSVSVNLLKLCPLTKKKKEEMSSAAGLHEEEAIRLPTSQFIRDSFRFHF